MVTTRNGVTGRLARIHVDLGSCFVVELVPIPLRPTVDLTAQDWDDLYRARNVTLWTVQVKREGWGGLIQFLIIFVLSISFIIFSAFLKTASLVVTASPTPR